MDYTPNIDAQGMRRPMGPVDQPNWNGGPKLIHNPQVMNNQTVGQPNLANAMANQRPIIPIRGRIVTSEQDIVPAEIPMDGSICLFMTEDCKKVIAKQWNSNGVLQSIIYSISSNEQAQSECQNGDSTGELKAQLDRIENMLKDIYEAENYCMQSKYYKSIVEAMGDGSYGYNPNRYASSGRYASAGHGSRYGYMPYLEGEDYTMQQYLTGDPTEFADQMKLRYGYMDQNEPKMMNKPVSTYGAVYDSWSDARKHYTKTGSSEDKERMERHGEEHVEKAIISMRDIWSEASPELKRRMKTELSTLVDGMSI